MSFTCTNVEEVIQLLCMHTHTNTLANIHKNIRKLHHIRVTAIPINNLMNALEEGGQ